MTSVGRHQSYPFELGGMTPRLFRERRIVHAHGTTWRLVENIGCSFAEYETARNAESPLLVDVLAVEVAESLAGEWVPTDGIVKLVRVSVPFDTDPALPL